MITIRDFEFQPSILEIEAGDNVIWKNDGNEVHTATSNKQEFDTGDIASGDSSNSILFKKPSGPSGLLYLCRRHPAVMQGTVMVRLAATRNVSSGYTTQEWQAIADIVAAFWVYDMADDFEHALANATGQDFDRIRTAWLSLNDSWKQLSGQVGPLTDRNQLRTMRADKLESIGRLIRKEYFALSPLVQQHPMRFPGLSQDPFGQSQDPFGKAIKVINLPPTDPVLQAFGREIRYASAAFGIQAIQDGGGQPTQGMIDQYAAAKAVMTPEDYRILANHQVSGLSKLFGSNKFDPAKFEDGIWRMTLAGEWDSPTFVGWHWLKWIQGYVGVVETGNVPDLVQLPSV